MPTPDELATAGLRTTVNSTCRGAALDLGATVTSWQPRGQRDVLFVSREALVGIDDEVHGGIPICAPWFGRGRDDVDVPRPHGLVRWVPWRLVEDTTSDAATTLVWECSGDEVAHLPGADAYPSDIWFRHEAQFGETLHLSFTTGSPSTSFVLDEAFHCYFAVSHISDVVIDGLAGTRYRDYTDGAAWHDADDVLRIHGHTDRIYDAPGNVTITDDDRIIALTPGDAASTIVWNPGPDGARSLTGWAGEEWTQMVCVEVGNVQHRAVTVPAGGSHTLSLDVAVRPLG
ncbi:aldose epimerase family protein [Tessaracoccus antarcticus]|uniref:Putative glucose-6-phosphate 1-epimerase n=1 Tax=Tessaracoccus antarcticus TaxID=2479848 RepID=A0A3M0G2P4_9ACTN|nr:hypothetical protein [Tessaracoccus antarcticus]RMB58407.1 hypothetical protein EAX62_14555 [Tessaracoccus antarcticus]